MKSPKVPNFNPVAKYARQFNKAAVHRNKKLDYVRKPKHRKGEDE